MLHSVECNLNCIYYVLNTVQGMKRLVEALLHAATYEQTVQLDESRDFQNSRPSYILPMVVSFVWVRVEFYS